MGCNSGKLVWDDSVQRRMKQFVLSDEHMNLMWKAFLKLSKGRTDYCLVDRFEKVFKLPPSPYTAHLYDLIRMKDPSVMTFFEFFDLCARFAVLDNIGMQEFAFTSFPRDEFYQKITRQDLYDYLRDIKKYHPFFKLDRLLKEFNSFPGWSKVEEVPSKMMAVISRLGILHRPLLKMQQKIRENTLGGTFWEDRARAFNRNKGDEKTMNVGASAVRVPNPVGYNEIIFTNMRSWDVECHFMRELALEKNQPLRTLVAKENRQLGRREDPFCWKAPDEREIIQYRPTGDFTAKFLRKKTEAKTRKKGKSGREDVLGAQESVLETLGLQMSGTGGKKNPAAGSMQAYQSKLAKRIKKLKEQNHVPGVTAAGGSDPPSQSGTSMLSRFSRVDLSKSRKERKPKAPKITRVLMNDAVNYMQQRVADHKARIAAGEQDEADSMEEKSLVRAVTKAADSFNQHQQQHKPMSEVKRRWARVRLSLTQVTSGALRNIMDDLPSSSSETEEEDDLRGPSPSWSSRSGSASGSGSYTGSSDEGEGARSARSIHSRRPAKLRIPDRERTEPGHYVRDALGGRRSASSGGRETSLSPQAATQRTSPASGQRSKSPAGARATPSMIRDSDNTGARSRRSADGRTPVSPALDVPLSQRDTALSSGRGSRSEGSARRTIERMPMRMPDPSRSDSSSLQRRADTSSGDERAGRGASTPGDNRYHHRGDGDQLRDRQEARRTPSSGVSPRPTANDNQDEGVNIHPRSGRVLMMGADESYGREDGSRSEGDGPDAFVGERSDRHGLDEEKYEAGHARWTPESNGAKGGVIRPTMAERSDYRPRVDLLERWGIDPETVLPPLIEDEEEVADHQPSDHGADYQPSDYTDARSDVMVPQPEIDLEQLRRRRETAAAQRKLEASLSQERSKARDILYGNRAHRQQRHRERLETQQRQHAEKSRNFKRWQRRLEDPTSTPMRAPRGHVPGGSPEGQRDSQAQRTYGQYAQLLQSPGPGSAERDDTFRTPQSAGRFLSDTGYGTPQHTPQQTMPSARPRSAHVSGRNRPQVSTRSRRSGRDRGNDFERRRDSADSRGPTFQTHDRSGRAGDDGWVYENPVCTVHKFAHKAGVNPHEAVPMPDWFGGGRERKGGAPLVPVAFLSASHPLAAQRKDAAHEALLDHFNQNGRRGEDEKEADIISRMDVIATSMELKRRSLRKTGRTRRLLNAFLEDYETDYASAPMGGVQAAMSAGRSAGSGGDSEYGVGVGVGVGGGGGGGGVGGGRGVHYSIGGSPGVPATHTHTLTHTHSAPALHPDRHTHFLKKQWQPSRAEHHRRGARAASLIASGGLGPVNPHHISSEVAQKKPRPQEKVRYDGTRNWFAAERFVKALSRTVR